MKKSSEYKIIMGNILTYYFQELINEGDLDPIKTIVEEFVNMLDVSKKQEQFILNEIKGLDLNINDYLDNMIRLTNIYKNDLTSITKEDIENIENSYKLLKKQVILTKKRVGA